MARHSGLESKMSGKNDKPTILFVDDDETAIGMFQTYMAKQPYRLILARSGHEALVIIEDKTESASRWKALDLDVILLDIMMPGIDGLKVCQYVKDNPVLRHIPIIMVTALNSPRDKVTALSFGADGYITKPYSFEELIGTIKASVAAKKLREDILRQLVELEALNSIAESAHRSMSLPLVLGSTLISLLELEYVEAAAIYTLDKSTDSLLLVQTQGPEGIPLPTVESCPMGQGITGQIGQSRHGQFFLDISSRPEFAERPKSPMRSYVGVVLRADERTMGVLEAFHRQPGWFKKRDVEWLSQVGRHVGQAIENANIFEHTQTLLLQSSSLQQ